MKFFCIKLVCERDGLSRQTKENTFVQRGLTEGNPLYVQSFDAFSNNEFHEQLSGKTDKLSYPSGKVLERCIFTHA